MLSMIGFMTRRFTMIFTVKIMAGFMFAFFTVPFAAWAEPERYDFPVFDRKEKSLETLLPPVLLSLPSPSLPSMPLWVVNPERAEAQRDEAKQNEAKQKSISALLQQYNKKLDDHKALYYADLIIRTSEKFGQDPFVIAAVVVNESSARHDAVSRGGDYGLMQVRWRVHQKKIKKKYPHIEKAKDMLVPENNVLVGTEIFSTYHASANQDVRDAVMFYSAGNKRLTDKVFAVLSQLEKSYRAHLKNS